MKRYLMRFRWKLLFGNSIFVMTFVLKLVLWKLWNFLGPWQIFEVPLLILTIHYITQLFFFLKEVRNATEAHTALTRDSPYVPRTLQMQLNRIDICRVLDGINLYVENNFIDSLGLGRDSNPDPSALKPSECTTTPSTSSLLSLVY
jgi:hypothetical protein